MYSPRAKGTDGTQRKAQLLNQLLAASKPKSIGRSKSAPKQEHRRYIETPPSKEEAVFEAYYDDVKRTAARVEEKIRDLVEFNEAADLGQSESDSALIALYTDRNTPAQDREYRSARVIHTSEIIETLEDTERWMIGARQAKGKLDKVLHYKAELAAEKELKDQAAKSKSKGLGLGFVAAAAHKQKFQKEKSEPNGEEEEEEEGADDAFPSPAAHGPASARVAPPLKQKLSNAAKIPATLPEDGDREEDEHGDVFSGNVGDAHHKIVTHAKTRNTRETIRLGKASKHVEARKVLLEEDEVILSADELFWRGSSESSRKHMEKLISSYHTDGTKEPASATPISSAEVAADIAAVAAKAEASSVATTIAPVSAVQAAADGAELAAHTVHQQNLYDSLLDKTEQIKLRFSQNLSKMLKLDQEKCVRELEDCKKEFKDLDGNLRVLRVENEALDKQLQLHDVSGAKILAMVEERLVPTINKLQENIKEQQGQISTLRWSALKQKGLSETAHKLRVEIEANAKAGKETDAALLRKARTSVFSLLQEINKEEEKKEIEKERSSALTRVNLILYKKVINDESRRLASAEQHLSVLDISLKEHEYNIREGKEVLRNKSLAMNDDIFTSTKRVENFQSVLDELRRCRKRFQTEDKRVKVLASRRISVLASKSKPNTGGFNADGNLKLVQKVTLLGRQPDPGDEVDPTRPFIAIEEALLDDYDSLEEKEQRENEDLDENGMSGTSSTGAPAESKGDFSLVDAKTEEILGLSRQHKGRDMRIELTHKNATSGPAPPAPKTPGKIIYDEKIVRKSVLSSVLAGAYGHFSPNWQKTAFDPLLFTGSAWEFDRCSIAAWDIVEGVDVAFRAASEIHALSVIQVQIVKKFEAKLGFLQHSVRTLGDAGSAASEEAESDLHEACNALINAILAEAPRALLLKNKRALMARTLRALLALLAVMKMCTRRGCDAETGKCGSYHNHWDADANAPAHGVTNDQLDEISVLVLGLVLEGTQQRPAVRRAGPPPRGRDQSIRSSPMVLASSPAANVNYFLASDGDSRSPSPSPSPERDLLPDGMSTHIPHVQLELPVAENAEEHATDSLPHKKKHRAKHVSHGHGKRSPSRGHGKHVKSCKHHGHISKKDQDFAGTALNADSWIQSLLNTCIGINPSASMDPDLPLGAIKAAVEAEMLKETASGGAFEVRHRNALVGCQLYLLVLCETSENYRDQWTVDSVLEAFEHASEQGRKLGYSSALPTLPPMEKILKLTNTRIVPALAALELFRCLLDEEVGRRAFITRIAQRDPEVSELQFLNVTLPPAADAAIGTKIRELRLAVAEAERNSKVVGSGKVIALEKTRLQPRAAIVQSMGGDTQKSVISTRHIHARMRQARNHWLTGMGAYVEKQIENVRNLIWRMQFAGANGSKEIEHPSFPLSPALQARLLAHVDMLESIVKTRPQDGESRVHSAAVELRACVNAVWALLEKLLATMDAFQTPLLVRFRWLYRQHVALKKREQDLKNQDHKVNGQERLYKQQFSELQVAYKKFANGEDPTEWPDAHTRKLLEDPDDDGLQNQLDADREVYATLTERQDRLKAEWDKLLRRQKRKITYGKIDRRVTLQKRLTSMRSVATTVKNLMYFEKRLSSSKSSSKSSVVVNIPIPTIVEEEEPAVEGKSLEPDKPKVRKPTEVLKIPFGKNGFAMKTEEGRKAYRSWAANAAVSIAAEAVCAEDTNRAVSLLYKLGKKDLKVVELQELAHRIASEAAVESGLTPVVMSPPRQTISDKMPQRKTLVRYSLRSDPRYRMALTPPSSSTSNMSNMSGLQVYSLTAGALSGQEEIVLQNSSSAPSLNMPLLAKHVSRPSRESSQPPSQMSLPSTHETENGNKAETALMTDEIEEEYLPISERKCNQTDDEWVSEMVAQKPIPLDIFHPAIAALLARAPVAPQSKGGHTSHHKHKYAYGNADTHSHVDSDTGVPLHAPKRLVPGEPVAPWLFDLDFLLPEEPLLMHADADDFQNTGLAGLAAGGGDEQTEGKADGEAVYRDPVSREAHEAEQQALLETLFGGEEGLETALDTAAAPDSKRTAQTRTAPIKTSFFSEKKTTQQRIKQKAADPEDTSTMSLSALFQSLWIKELGSGLDSNQAAARFGKRQQELKDAKNTVKFKSVTLCTPPGGDPQFRDATATTVLSVLCDSVTKEEREQLQREYVQFAYKEGIFIDVDDANSMESSSTYAKQSYQWWAKNAAKGNCENSATVAEASSDVRAAAAALLGPVLITPAIVASPPPHVKRHDDSMYVEPVPPTEPAPSYRRKEKEKEQVENKMK